MNLDTTRNSASDESCVMNNQKNTETKKEMKKTLFDSVTFCC